MTRTNLFDLLSAEGKKVANGAFTVLTAKADIRANMSKVEYYNALSDALDSAHHYTERHGKSLKYSEVDAIAEWLEQVAKEESKAVYPLKSRRINFKAVLAATLIISLIAFVSCLVWAFNATTAQAQTTEKTFKLDECYSQLLIVSDLEYLDNGDTLVTFSITATPYLGYTYEHYYKGQDICVGEIYSAIMWKNGTDDINNDMILDISFERPDLLPGYDIFY